MAGLAVHKRVLTGFLHIQHVRMTVLASLVPGKLHRMGGDIADRVPAVVAVLPKTARNHVSTNYEK
jgi:hypothetical protein